ncbi:MAG: hypothetical protein HC878_03485 [Leptolyngbyaceae cyanobacterium SL_5_14]|nr:hypothetical protein [Leptolyngbyaceae cyanobacterium SL_5_14]
MRFKFRPGFYLLPNNGDGTDPTPGPTPTSGGDDLAGLRSALQAERARANQLQGQVQQLTQQYEGIDPTAARQALERLPSLEQQLNTTRIESAAGNVLSQIVPEYRDLFRSSISSQLQVNDQGQVLGGDGRSLDQISSDLKTRFPNMFIADAAPTGAGVTASNGGATPPPSVVTATNGVITGVNPDDVIGGKVQIQ